MDLQGWKSERVVALFDGHSGGERIIVVEESDSKAHVNRVCQSSISPSRQFILEMIFKEYIIYTGVRYIALSHVLAFMELPSRQTFYFFTYALQVKEIVGDYIRPWLKVSLILYVHTYSVLSLGSYRGI